MSMRLEGPRCCHGERSGTDLVELPASFWRSSLGQVPATPLEQLEQPARPDPIDAWLDLSTVANVVSTFSNLLRLGG